MNGDQFDDVVRRAIEEYKKTIELFKPAYGHRAYNEQNCLFHFGHAFIDGDPDAHVALEVPLVEDERNPGTKRIDAFLFTRDWGLFLEAKVWDDEECIQDVADDLDRLTPEVLRQIVNRQFRQNKGRIPPRIHRGCLVEAWYKEDEEPSASARLIAGVPLTVYLVRDWQPDSKWKLYWLAGSAEVPILQ